MDSMMEGVGKGSADDTKRELFLVGDVLSVFLTVIKHSWNFFGMQWLTETSTDVLHVL